MMPTAKIAPTAGHRDDQFGRWLNIIGLTMFAFILFFGLCIREHKRPILVDVGSRIGSFHEAENESSAYLHTGEMLPEDDTVRFGGRVYRVVGRDRDLEWGNMYSLERVTDEQ